MTETHDPNAAPAEDNVDETPWTPPATLTPPQATTSRPPVMAFAAALGVALLAGLALWVTSQVIYVYIFCNLIIGGGIGWALALAPKRSGFTNVPALMAPAVLLCALPYLLMRVGFYLQMLPDIEAQGIDLGLFEFLVWFLANDSLFGLEIGLIGNVILLFVEVGITVYAAHGRLMQGIAEARIASVPDDVVTFVVQGLAHDWDTARVREELQNRGWTNAADQDRAIGTGFDVIAALQARQAA